MTARVDAGEQLDLFAVSPPAEPEFALVPVCHLCGKRGEPVPVEGGGSAPWRAAESFAYAARQAHLQQEHPESYRGPV